jgi:hypothetical protein
MRTIEEIDTECAQAVLELGRKTYHRNLLERETTELSQKVYNLNVEAFQVREALAAAQAQLAAQAPVTDAQTAGGDHVEG